jgi:hypothetical protein
MLSRIDVANDGAETNFLSHLGAAYDAMALSLLKSSHFPHTTGLLKAFTFFRQRNDFSRQKKTNFSLTQTSNVVAARLPSGVPRAIVGLKNPLRLRHVQYD